MFFVGPNEFLNCVRIVRRGDILPIHWGFGGSILINIPLFLGCIVRLFHRFEDEMLLKMLV